MRAAAAGVAAVCLFVAVVVAVLVVLAAVAVGCAVVIAVSVVSEQYRHRALEVPDFIVGVATGPVWG